MEKQACEYSLNLFTSIKNKHSKLDNLRYEDLKIKNHLTSTENTVNQAKILMLYRSRMARYAHNHEQTEEILDCKLCGNHPDQQEEIYACDYDKKEYC